MTYVRGIYRSRHAFVPGHHGINWRWVRRLNKKAPSVFADEALIGGNDGFRGPPASQKQPFDAIV